MSGEEKNATSLLSLKHSVYLSGDNEAPETIIFLGSVQTCCIIGQKERGMIDKFAAYGSPSTHMQFSSLCRKFEVNKFIMFWIIENFKSALSEIMDNICLHAVIHYLVLKGLSHEEVHEDIHLI